MIAVGWMCWLEKTTFPGHLSLLGVKGHRRVVQFALQCCFFQNIIITLDLAVLWVFGVHDEQNACIHSLPRISHKHDSLSRNSSRNMVVFQVSFCEGFAAAVLSFRLFSNFSNK